MQTHFPSGDGSDPGGGLLLAPFRGIRYDLSRVGGLANVTSPPYDVIGPGTLERLRDASPYNVVRLILPADAPESTKASAASTAAARLRGWLAEGVLAVDDAPAFYVYEQRAEGWVQRGLIGLVAVGTDAVHPHEGVMPGPVAGRQELMKETRSNLEPILLVYNGGAAAGGHGGPAGLEGGLPGGHPSVPPGTASRLTDLTADRQAPLASVATDDGVTHRLWAVTNPAAQAATIVCLIEAGADPNAANKSGVAPLHRAVRTRCATAVRTLLDCGADPVRRNRNGSTPMLLAVENTGRGGTGSPEAKAEQQEILRLLERRGSAAEANGDCDVQNT